MRFPLCLFLLAVFSSTAFHGLFAEEGKYLLRYRFKKGEELRWNVQQKLEITTSLKGKTETVETSSRSTKIWKVLDVSEDGVATFEYKVGDVDMKRSQTDRKDEHYDSRVDKKIPTAFQTIDGTIGVPLAELSIDSLGETKKKKVLTAYSGAGEENRITIPLPKEKVAVGESWSVDTPIEVPQVDGTVKKIKARQKFTLDSVKTDVAKISFKTQILTVIDDPRLESQILDKYSSGSFELDLDAKHLISQRTTVEKEVVGFDGGAGRIRHFSRFMECCCGAKSCEICSKNLAGD